MLGWFFHRYLLLLVLLIPLWSMGVQASTDPTGQSDYERGMAELKQGQNKKALYWLKQATKKIRRRGSIGST